MPASREEITMAAEVDKIAVKDPKAYLGQTGLFSLNPIEPGSLAEALWGRVGTELSPI
jgi:hypothetical protein